MFQKTQVKMLLLFSILLILSSLILFGRPLHYFLLWLMLCCPLLCCFYSFLSLPRLSSAPSLSSYTMLVSANFFCCLVPFYPVSGPACLCQLPQPYFVKPPAAVNVRTGQRAVNNQDVKLSGVWFGFNMSLVWFNRWLVCV